MFRQASARQQCDSQGAKRRTQATSSRVRATCRGPRSVHSNRRQRAHDPATLHRFRSRGGHSWPIPADSPWSQTDKEATWAVVADDLWAAAISRHPQLARPVVAAEREIDAGEIDTYLRPCLEGSGIDLGSYSALEWMPVAEGDYVAWYTCRVKFPLLSSAPPNDEQVGYLYDYFTQFVVPCLEANGSAIDSAPSRDTFVREWPNQDWFPEPTTSAPGTAEYASASAVCPSTPPGA